MGFGCVESKSSVGNTEFAIPLKYLSKDVRDQNILIKCDK